jgi:hypothetical protein
MTRASTSYGVAEPKDVDGRVKPAMTKINADHPIF